MKAYMLLVSTVSTAFAEEVKQLCGVVKNRPSNSLPFSGKSELRCFNTVCKVVLNAK